MAVIYQSSIQSFIIFIIHQVFHPICFHQYLPMIFPYVPIIFHHFQPSPWLVPQRKTQAAGASSSGLARTVASKAQGSGPSNPRGARTAGGSSEKWRFFREIQWLLVGYDWEMTGRLLRYNLIFDDLEFNGRFCNEILRDIIGNSWKIGWETHHLGVSMAMGLPQTGWFE